MKENKFQKRIKKQLESQAAFVINVHGHRMQISGLPDLQVIHKDWKGWLELKVEKGVASELQRIQAAKFELRGVPVYVLRCIERDSWNFENPRFGYLLENFQGEVIEEIDNLSSLLGVLIELSKPNEDKQLIGNEICKNCKASVDCERLDYYGYRDYCKWED